MSIDPVSVAKGIGNIVAGPAIQASKEWIKYVMDCEENVKTVQELHHDLENLREEVGWKVDLGNMKSQDVVPEVTEWIKGVDDFIGSKKEWKELLKDEEARKKAEQCCFGFGWSPRYRHNLSKKAEEKAIATRKKIEKMKNRGQEPVTRDAKPVKLSSFTSSAFCKGLESREKKLTEILEVLDNDKVNRIGIHGMGGSGKTTLIQELARQAEDDKVFNAVIIAEISQFPDYKRIQDQIAERIGFSTLDHYHNIEERALNLGKRLRDLNRRKGLSDDGEQRGPTKGGKQHEDGKEGEAKKKLDNALSKKNIKKPDEKVFDEKGQIKNKKMDGIKEDGENDEKEDRANKGKKPNEKDTRGMPLVGQAEKSGKMLVILDNMWKKLDLHLIGIPYELQKDLGCKIIVISRSEDVCKAMDASGSCTFKLGDLSDQEADHLFRDRVGTIVDDPDLKEISKKLLKKCSRLPLTINVLADTLKNQTLSVWERVLRQLEKPILGETLGVLDDTYSIIELSYNYLGNKEKKMFFLLCCLFPPGSSVHIDDLLKYGIGMGLFQYVNSVVEATDQAYKWADDLKSLSLLMDVDVIKGVIHIHDDVREAGKSFAAKGNQAFHVGAIPKWLLKDSYEKYTIISMVSSSSYKYLAGRSLPQLQLLRSLGLSCSKLGEDYFLGMQNLKVLDMSKSDIKALPSSFENLKNLVTLLLEYCSLEDVTRVSKLVKLQVLSFRGSNITRLPRKMEALVELKLLDLTKCKQLKEIPFGIFACLLKLEGLYMKHSFSNWKIQGSMASLSELTYLPLHVLEITIQDISQLLDGDLPILNLSNYKIDLVVSAQIIKQLPDDHLPISSLPGNVKDLAATAKITETKKKLVVSQQEQLFSRDLLLGGVHAHNLVRKGWKPLMNKAESLYLKEIEGLENVVPYLGEYGWRELKRITVSECPELDCIINRKADYQSAVFPKLEMLRLENLPALEAIYQGKSPPELFSNLQELTLSYLNQLRSSAIAVQHATRLKVVEVKNCENLESIFFAPTAMQFGARGETKSSNEIQFPCLRKLILTNLEAFQGLFAKTNPDDSKLLFFPNQVAFPVLDKIKLERLGQIEQIWDMATGKEFATAFPELRTISLAYMDQLQHIWSAELCNTDSISFEKLKKLKIRECDTLEFVCPASVAFGFHKLELLQIISCDQIQQVIAAEGGEGELNGSSLSPKKMTISFPKLFNIDLVSLPSLVYFYKGRMMIEFPALKNLKLDDVLNLKALTKVKRISKETPYPEDEYYILFNKESKFPCLERLYAKNLYIEGLWNIKINQYSLVFPNLQSLFLQEMRDLKHVWTKELTGATRMSINLKEIEISSCGSLESLFPPSSAGSSTNTIAEELKVVFPELHTIKVESSDNFMYVLEGNVNLAFPALKTIILRDLDEMVAFAKLEKLESPKGEEEDSDDGDDPPIPLFNGKINLSLLEELQVGQLPKIEKLWGMTRFDEFSQAFTSLRTLVIEYLPELKHVWIHDPTEESLYSGSLETIGITYCDKIESLFSCSKEASTAPSRPQHLKVISLPKLKKLILMHLENFSCLFQGYINMEFQGLKGLEINQLPSVKTLVKLRNSCDAEKEIKTDMAKEESETGKDNDISMDGVLFKGNVEFSSLEELKIECMPQLESIYETEEENGVDYTSIFPKLKTLHLTGENEVLKQLISEAMLHKLTSLAIRKFGQFKYLVSSSSKGNWDALVNSLSILVNLEELIIEDCKSLEELFEGQDVTLMLSSLKKLELSGLPKLKRILWRTLPNLQSLRIADETSLGGKKFLISATEVAAGELSILQSLESLEISDFAEIDSIIGEEENDQFQKDGHELMFPKLKEVKIGRMISLRTFCSTSFPMYLPSLVSIDFNGCDNLRSFSVAPMVIPKQLSSLKVDDDAVALDGFASNILQFEIDSSDKVADWPRKVASKLHPEHQLSLKNWRLFGCDGCREGGGRYSYTCIGCDFDLHPYCALDESQLIEEPDEMKVGKDFPRTVKHESHEEHELKLLAGRVYICDGCGELGVLFVYNCDECDFDLHPKCALETSSPEDQP